MDLSKAGLNGYGIPFLKNNEIDGTPAVGREETLSINDFPSRECFSSEAESSVNGEGKDDGSTIARVTHKLRDVGTVQLIFLCFFLTAGGPFGVEDCVLSCGVAPTLIGLVAAPFLYVLPQIAMTAELSTMMPENGSYVVWVCRGCGTFWGCINGYNSLLCNIFDNAIYPVLVMDYWQRLYPDSLTNMEVLMVKMGIVVAGAFVNLFRVRFIGNFSAIFTLVVLSPFVAGFCITFRKITPSKQWTWSPPTDHNRDWASFLSTLLWLHTGWDGLGSVAGEVKNGKTSYIRAVVICALMNCFVYLTAIISAATVPTEGILNPWSDAYLLTVSEQFFPRYGGIYVAIVSAIDNICMYFVAISTTSRAIMKMADDGRDDKFMQNKMALMPGFMGLELKATSSPIVAIVVQSILIMFLVQFDFTFLVEVDAFANSISLLLEFISFIRLRYTEPEAKRPYKVPGGICVAWVITLMKLTFVIAIIVIMADEYQPLMCIVIFNLLVTIIYFVRVKVLRRR